MKKEDVIEASELFEYIVTDVFLFCECGTTETHRTDEFTAIDKFYENGWRVIREKCLCKECIEKLKIK